VSDDRRDGMGSTSWRPLGPPPGLAAPAPADRPVVRQRTPHVSSGCVRVSSATITKTIITSSMPLGRKVELLAGALLRIAVQVLVPQGRILLAIDDTPSKRYGPKVEGAGLHHNPTPGTGPAPSLR